MRKYNDRLILIAFAILITFFLEFFSLERCSIACLSSEFKWLNIGSTLVCVVSFLLLNKKIINWLDHKMLWEDQFLERFLLQNFLSFLLALSIAFLQFSLMNGLICKNPTIAFWIPEIIVALLWALIVNLIYTILYFLSQKIYYTSSSPKKIFAFLGHSTIPISLKNIAYVHRENELIKLITFEGEEYGLSETLEKCSKLLPNDQFFRVSRQVIVNKDAIKIIRNGTGRKLELQLVPHSYPVEVSKTKVALFKAWVVH